MHHFSDQEATDAFYKLCVRYLLASATEFQHSCDPGLDHSKRHRRLLQSRSHSKAEQSLLVDIKDSFCSQASDDHESLLMCVPELDEIASSVEELDVVLRVRPSVLPWMYCVQ